MEEGAFPSEVGVLRAASLPPPSSSRRGIVNGSSPARVGLHMMIQSIMGLTERKKRREKGGSEQEMSHFTTTRV